MSILKNVIKYSLLGCIMLTSCAGLPKESPPQLYWPFPPEEPRIKFLDLIIGSIDVVGVRSGKFKQLLFGEEPEIGFRKPSYIYVRDNILYITDVNLIHVYDFRKKEFRFLGVRLLRNANGIVVTPDRRVFVGDSAKKRVYIIYPNGKASILGNINSFDTPAGLALDEVNKRLIVVDAKRHEVSIWSLSGEFLFSIGKRGVGPGEFNIPYDVAVDKDGRIYVVDSGNFRVQVFDKDGKFLSAFGGVGMIPGSFARPKGIALDSEGHIYVVDASFGNFQIFNTDGSAFLAVGTGGSEPGKFILPLGIFIDKDDKIYVVDQMNRRIQIFQYLKKQAGSSQ